MQMLALCVCVCVCVCVFVNRIESLGGFPTDTCVLLPGWR